MAEEDYLAVIESLPRQIEEAFRLGKDIEVEGEFDKIVICGMGGSAVPGSILQSYLDLRIPVLVVRDYMLPAFVSKKTLVFVISYSGNTEETISCFKEGLGKGCRMVCITSGGKLKELANRHEKPLILVPSGLQPRAAIPYQFFPLLNVLYNAKLIPDPKPEVEATVAALRRKDFKERAEDLANKIGDKIPIIYSSARFKAVAYRWKTQINENAKVHAFCHVFPELDHNEIVGYTKLNANYYVVILQDEYDYSRNKDRMRITKNLISRMGVSSTEIIIKGEHLLTRIFSAIHIGDMVSYFLALNYGVDPVPVEIIESLKKELGEKKF